MIKRFVFPLLALAVLAGASYAGIEIKSRFGPTIASNAISTIAAPPAGQRNCITNLIANSDAQFTLRVLDGATTAYSIVSSSGSTVIQAFDEATFCGTAATATYITVTGGNYTVTRTGFVY